MKIEENALSLARLIDVRFHVLHFLKPPPSSHTANVDINPTALRSSRTSQKCFQAPQIQSGRKDGRLPLRGLTRGGTPGLPTCPTLPMEVEALDRGHLWTGYARTLGEAHDQLGLLVPWSHVWRLTFFLDATRSDGCHPDLRPAGIQRVLLPSATRGGNLEEGEVLSHGRGEWRVVDDDTDAKRVSQARTRVRRWRSLNGDGHSGSDGSGYATPEV